MLFEIKKNNFEMWNKFMNKNILVICDWYIYVIMLFVYSYVDKWLVYIFRYIFYVC